MRYIDRRDVKRIDLTPKHHATYISTLAVTPPATIQLAPTPPPPTIIAPPFHFTSLHQEVLFFIYFWIHYHA